MKKKNKTELRRDTVQSETFHVGIELELKAIGESDREHDDDACAESFRENLESESNMSLLTNWLGLDRSSAGSVSDYFDRDAYIEDQVQNHSCDDEYCCFQSNGATETRENIESELRSLTGNRSFKVVSDGSIYCDAGEVDAEVCWNYFASRETIKDNKKILDYLKSINCTFDESCGLHINLNNYLNIKCKDPIETSYFDLLFNFVAPSRRTNRFCNEYGISSRTKYSMMYEQGDRIEFRFFSPTLEADKLNHYVTLANVIYKRLAGKKCKLPKKTETYFLNKMMKVNEVSHETALKSIDFVNSLKDYNSILNRQEEINSILNRQETIQSQESA